MYKAIEMFTDLQDDNYKYEVGDEYPRLGLKPSLARIEELKGSDNKQHTPLIEEIELNVDDIMALSVPSLKFEDTFNWGGDIVDEIF